MVILPEKMYDNFQLKFLKIMLIIYLYATEAYSKIRVKGAWLASSVECVTLDIGAVCLSPKRDVEITLKNTISILTPNI